MCRVSNDRPEEMVGLLLTQHAIERPLRAERIRPIVGVNSLNPDGLNSMLVS